MELLNKKENIFGDDIGFVEHYDFSQANLNQENRLNAITSIASVCYANPKAVGSESLFNRLAAESKGLPSSSFEMCPILIHVNQLNKITNNNYGGFDIVKYGEFIVEDKNSYLLTNYRALLQDVEKNKLPKSMLETYNTEKACDIIKKHYKVFKFKVDLNTSMQMIRHRAHIQQLSRRYVSGNKMPFEFYISEKMKNVYTNIGFSEISCGQSASTKSIVNLCLEHYNNAIEAGVKPQEARRIIPQAAYTTLWMGFLPKNLDNYFKLRLETTAQWEIRQTAIAMQELINKEKE